MSHNRNVYYIEGTSQQTKRPLKTEKKKEKKYWECERWNNGFKNWTGQRIGKISDSWFSSQTGGQTNFVINNLINDF